MPPFLSSLAVRPPSPLQMQQTAIATRPATHTTIICINHLSPCECQVHPISVHSTGMCFHVNSKPCRKPASASHLALPALWLASHLQWILWANPPETLASTPPKRAQITSQAVKSNLLKRTTKDPCRLPRDRQGCLESGPRHLSAFVLLIRPPPPDPLPGSSSSSSSSSATFSPAKKTHTGFPVAWILLDPVKKAKKKKVWPLLL